MHRKLLLSAALAVSLAGAQTVDGRVARLTQALDLTSAQQAQAQTIFTEEGTALAAASGASERAKAKASAAEAFRLILTAEQQAKYAKMGTRETPGAASRRAGGSH
jgi:hypothetical protein